MCKMAVATSKNEMWAPCRFSTMGVLTVIVILLAHQLPVAQALGSHEMKDFCLRESFEAKCAEDEIVTIKEARYGRMSAGRCISQEAGHIGCSNDVTTYMDGLCSGRHQCSSTVRLLMDIAQPCPKDFTNYLEASYSCRKVATGNREECHRNNYVTLQEQEGNLASMITEETGYGSAGCPWRVKVLPGQKINLTLYDFNRPWSFAVSDGYVRKEAGDGCPVSLIVEDGKEKKNIRLCDSGERTRHLYTSKSNDILVHFSIRTMTQKHYYYMVNYKAVACPDLQVAPGAWQRREGDNARVQCNASGEVWYLTCRDGRWIGDLGNCTALAADAGPSRAAFPIGLLLAVIIGVVLGVVIGACLLGIVFLCRKGYTSQRRGEGTSILRQGGRHQVPITEILYTESEGGRMRTVARDPRSPQRSGPVPDDYGQKTPLDSSTTQNARNSMDEQTRKAIPDFVQGVEDSRLTACMRNHVYESPKFAQAQQQMMTSSTGRHGGLHVVGRHGGGPPVYHELDADNNVTDDRCPRHIDH